MNLIDYNLAPKTFERQSECEAHGVYNETGGSMTGREDRVCWFGCPTCNRIQREHEDDEASAQEESARQKRIEGKLNEAGIPLAFRDRTFASFIVQSVDASIAADMQMALDVSKEFADNFWSKHAKQGSFLVFGGLMGTGKSHLALSIAQHVMRRSTVMYLDAIDMIRRVRGTYRRDSPKSEEEMIDLFGGQIDLLIIDEVGVQRGTEDEQMILVDIINRRYRDLRPTILLTNLEGKAFSVLMGPRVMSRLNERAQFVRFKWEDQRSKMVRS